MPRPQLSPASVTATQSQALNVALACSITLATNQVISVWSGVGPISTPDNNFIGIGSFGMISSIEEGHGVFARGVVLTLSGFDATLLSDVIGELPQGSPVTVYLLINGTFVTAWSGRTDQPRIQVSGNTASISIACENRLVEMNTSASQFRYTQECQSIFFPQDLAFSSVNSISQQTLYWGRTPGNTNLGIPTS